MFVQVALAKSQERITLRAAPDQRASLGLGTPVALDFDLQRALLFDADGTRLRGLQQVSAAASEVA